MVGEQNSPTSLRRIYFIRELKIITTKVEAKKERLRYFNDVQIRSE